MVQDVLVAIIEVGDLSKTFKVPVREQGLRASLRSLVHRETREAVTGRLTWQPVLVMIGFTIVLLVFSRWCWQRGLRRYGGASA